MEFIKKALGACTIGLALLPYYASAGSGSAILPHWDTWKHGTYVYISNITTHSIKINVTFYGMNGEKLAPAQFFNIYDNLLKPKSSGYIKIKPESDNRGYAVIEWKNVNEEDDHVALVAHAARVTQADGTRRGDYSISINAGLPF